MKRAKVTRQRQWSLLSLISALLILAVGIGLAFAMNDGMKKLPIKKFFAQSDTNAVWDWSNVNNKTDADIQQAASFLYMHQINTVFVDISSYADIAQNKDAQSKAAQTKSLSASIQRYIKGMSGRNIKVFAAAGNTDWSQPDQQHIPLAIQQFVFDYNQTHNQKFAGLEFDIESYNQSHFTDASFTEKGLVLTDFLDTVDKIASRQEQHNKATGDTNFELGFAIPYWYDNENENIKSVDWKDKTGPTLYHILDRLNQLPKTNVVVMAYRNAALGNDGMVYHARTEVDYATSKAPHVNVLIGVEVNDVEPAKITFYGKSYTELSSEVKLLSQQFENTSFHGITINDLDGYQEMKNDAN